MTSLTAVQFAKELVPRLMRQAFSKQRLHGRQVLGATLAVSSPPAVAAQALAGFADLEARRASHGNWLCRCLRIWVPQGGLAAELPHPPAGRWHAASPVHPDLSGSPTRTMRWDTSRRCVDDVQSVPRQS